MLLKYKAYPSDLAGPKTSMESNNMSVRPLGMTFELESTTTRNSHK
jgi:hypothetical protein